MKKYRIAVIDWNYKNGRIIRADFANGIKEVRAYANEHNFNLHYSRNAKCWQGLYGNLEMIATNN